MARFDQTLSETSSSPEQYYSLIRSQIEHEDNLIGVRLSWFLAAQSFLFTAYAIVVSNFRLDGAPFTLRQERVLLKVIPVVAIVTCMLVFVTIVAGVLAIVNLRRLYQTHVPESQQHRLPPIQGYRRTQLIGQAAPLLLPPVFFAAWVFLVVRGGNP
jgi:hypothetical protein